nr:MAG TPA: protein of unknown function (DUF4656) [Caudoviricetes sp.]
MRGSLMSDNSTELSELATVRLVHGIIRLERRP